MRLARALVAAALAAALLAGAAACGGSEGRVASSGTGADGLEPNAADGEEAVLDPALDPDAGTAPDGAPFGASEVAARLRVIKELARSATVALGPNDQELLPEDAAPLQAQIASEWSDVAAMVRERDEATHRTLEEAFPAFGAAVGARDPAAAGAAADRIAGAVDAYVARFPPDDPPADMPDEDEDGEPDDAEPGDGSMPGFTPAPEPSPADAPTP